MKASQSSQLKVNERKNSQNGDGKPVDGSDDKSMFPRTESRDTQFSAGIFILRNDENKELWSWSGFSSIHA